ncbi:FeoA family protein [Actinomyces culturomici]|uniref:FeoA family protein n=1 Tax=Actinomyces culturomici TaxID=1926276 RepID=UPI000E202614|nr:FeoA family protein [Actinomyces culturomici]
MLLSKCPRNSRGRLTRIDVEPAFRLRLQELGLRPGTEFYVANRAAFGGVVLNIAGTRVAVDAKSAKRIDVEVAA